MHLFISYGYTSDHCTFEDVLSLQYIVEDVNRACFYSSVMKASSTSINFMRLLVCLTVNELLSSQSVMLI